ncbi:MAG: cytochrome C oxidase subunit IV family protein [Anaerolineaceae bacterium]|nr:cytochrome C oxidase subunit IV family protein [Anaerolineaceae bacterium]MCY3934975.1 cytochrome C oxidase subunit IV family protein [Chloroflexota bacterium]MCY4008799.1 cytochrome C oxidase subunit IV family protein [Anaerolineaceae bacterium]MCY4106832.1 cytochrome C oxidase subunit IV family protein [Chloroflexota bacterium]
MTDEAHPHHHDAIILPGDRRIRLPGGIYTFVFVVLALLTLIEIFLAGMPEGPARVLVLFGIAIGKAALVVIYYMHLKDDRRIFAWTLLVPLIFATLGGFFLLLSPVPYSL